MGELVVVHKAREPVLASVPDVPDERPLVEPLAVLLEEAVAEPVVEGRSRACPGLGQQLVLQRRRPFRAEGGFQNLTQPLGGGRFTPYGGNGNDPVASRPGRRVCRPLGPASDSRGDGPRRPGGGSVEPLGWPLKIHWVGSSLNAALEVLLDTAQWRPLPPFEIEGNLDESRHSSPSAIDRSDERQHGNRRNCRSTRWQRDEMGLGARMAATLLSKSPRNRWWQSSPPV